MRSALLILTLLFSAAAGAQQPQTSDVSNTQPLYSVNAKYVRGVGPGYWPTAGSGLTLNVAAGTSWCAGTVRTYAGGTLTLANNTTNYVYLDPTSNCAPATSTTVFSAAQIPIAVVVTSSGAITTINDDRLGFSLFSISGLTGILNCSQMPAHTGDVTSSSGSCATTAVALHLSPTPSLCSSGNYARGIDAGGNATGCTSASVVRGISLTIGDPAATSALTAASTTTDYVTVPFGCTISAYNLAIDAGTITVKFWKIASGTAIPTSSNSINTSGVAVSSGTAIHSTTLSDFTTTTIAANDILAMNVTAVATAKYVNGVLQCQ